MTGFSRHGADGWPWRRWLAILVRSYAVKLPQAREAYAFSHQPEVLTPAQWLKDGWQRLPQRRIGFDGERKAPFGRQIAVEPPSLREVLAREGWSRAQTAGFWHSYSRLLPSSRPLHERQPFAMYHDGRIPVATFIQYPPQQNSVNSRRRVLRLFDSSFVLDMASGQKIPILLPLFETETLEKAWFGFTELEEMHEDNRESSGTPAGQIPGLFLAPFIHQEVAPDVKLIHSPF